MILWRELLRFLEAKLLEFRDTDFAQVQLESKAWAIGVGVFLLTALTLKLLFSRKRRGRAHSGHIITVRCRESPWVQVRRSFPKCIAAIGVLFVLIALAKPFLPKVKNVEFIESRERIELQDVSTSAGWPFLNTGKSEAEIAREAHLKFLEMRRGSHDRVSYWLFSRNPYKVEDFIVDDEVYMFQVYDAPYVITGPSNPWLPGNGGAGDWEWGRFGGGGGLYPKVIAPKEKIRLIEGEGSTYLDEALRAIIKYFDERGNPKIKQKTLLIITDGASETYPEAELKELQRRRVKIYLLFIKPNEEGERGFLPGGDSLARAERLVKDVRSMGGKSYNVEDPETLARAFADINRSESVKVRVERTVVAPTLFQRFLFVGVILFCAGLLLAWFMEMFSPEYP